ncbi:MAG: Fe-S protein assembly co-chaperone HscB [Proteobacteria bacterium]|nr:Fe-S protein assembly co-chaperone HscB [Pseudomonadota bacterium]
MFDPFDVFGFEKGFFLDLKVLEKCYFEEQKKFHPDRFALAEMNTKADAIRKSTMLNQAYSLLKDPLERAAFLLKEKGFELMTHDSFFLSQVMEWSERQDRGEDITRELQVESERLFKSLEDAFVVQDYASAREALYRLTYVRKMMKAMFLGPG